MWVWALCAFAHAAQASVGLTQIRSGAEDGGLVTVFYPSSTPSTTVVRDGFSMDVAWSGAALRGNDRLVVISHGSGGWPWIHADLARALVEAGFVVALPEHSGDNAFDHSLVGPQSWMLRPVEVSRAIDAVLHEPRFGVFLAMNQVGVFGMSAGGHTALTMAGGRWSPSVLLAHCQTHLTEDFHTCVGLTTQLNGDLWDGLKKRVARWVLSIRLNDSAWYSHHDPRVAAVVAGVPLAVDFDEQSLAQPRVPLALISAGQDRWLAPAFHAERVLNVCAPCQRIADSALAGHGALLSPLPPLRAGLLASLLEDPVGFDRTNWTREMNRKVVEFFQQHLLK